MIEHCGFQATEAEVERVATGLCRAELHRRGGYLGGSRQPVKNGPSRVAKRQQLRDFVISFARRVVARLSEPAVAKKRARHRNTGVFGVHFAKKRVASGNNQAHGRQFGNAPRFVRFKKNGVDVMAVWQNLDEPTTLIYLLSYKDRAAREAGWAGFNADPKWTELRTKYFVPLTTKVIFMSAADYSPLK